MDEGYGVIGKEELVEQEDVEIRIINEEESEAIVEVFGDRVDEQMENLEEYYLPPEEKENRVAVPKEHDYAAEFERYAEDQQSTRHKHNCRYCLKTFHTYRRLSDHVVQCHEKKFRCTKCDARFYSRAELIQHKLTGCDNVIKPFECEECALKFTLVGDLEEHQRRSHTRANAVFQCDECDYKYLSRYALMEHRKTHLPRTNRFKCDLCPASYRYGASLIRHRALHKVEKQS